MSPTFSATKSNTPPDPDLAAASYGRILRVIGHDLAGLFPRTLKIETDGVVFEAMGESHPNPFEVVKENFFAKIWKTGFIRGFQRVPGEPQTPPASFSRAYDLDEIERIERQNSARTDGNFRRADNYSLAERLKTMGAIVDAKNGRFKGLRKERDRLFVEFWDPQGQLQSAKLTTVIMYRSQHQPDLQPRNEPLELWEGYDF